MKRARLGCVAVLLAGAVAGVGAPSALGAPHHRRSAAPRGGRGSHPGAPSLGSHVIVLDPSMPQSEIQATLDAISAQQVPSQFGTGRYAILFKPGTYGSAAAPLVFQVGYYTQVAGLGAMPGDVVINGAIDVFNGGDGTGLDNFWRSLSNLKLNVTLPARPPAYSPAPPESPGCANQQEFWAVSQAAPMRRVIVDGNLFLFDYCNTGFTSGGYLASDEFTGGAVINGSQQQFFTRNSDLDNWTNGVWNQVFMGDRGAPATNFGSGGQYTTLARTPLSEEPPFLYVDRRGSYRVFVPAVRRNSLGPSYAGGSDPGASLPLDRFLIADPHTPLGAINAALRRGRDLILTPGIYDLSGTIEVSHPHTVILGLGFPTLIPERGQVAMRTASVPGNELSGMIFDAGPRNSPALLELGGTVHGRPHPGGSADPNAPTLLSDVFFRIGGAEPGLATDSLIVNTDNTILDDVWAWRADHGAGVGWESNRAATGLVVNGDNVKAYGLAVEHYQKYEVVWNGQGGEDVFFQNEMPYDPPSQAAWMSSPTTDGYAAFLVTPRVRSFQGYGMGSYSFFDQGVPIYATQAFQSSDRPGVRFHDLLTVFLNPHGGSGGILSVINGVGGSSTAANPDVPVDVITYPPGGRAPAHPPPVRRRHGRRGAGPPRR
jgi:hypothetical protein